jgi:hypothetical protein
MVASFDPGTKTFNLEANAQIRTLPSRFHATPKIQPFIRAE